MDGLSISFNAQQHCSNLFIKLEFSTDWERIKKENKLVLNIGVITVNEWKYRILLAIGILNMRFSIKKIFHRREATRIELNILRRWWNNNRISRENIWIDCFYSFFSVRIWCVCAWFFSFLIVDSKRLDLLIENMWIIRCLIRVLCK